MPKNLKSHVFICTNERAEGHPRGCCAERWKRANPGAESLVDLMKKEVLAKGLSDSVRAQRAGCLDVCESGPAIVVYPEGVWYGDVSAGDVKEIVESHLVNGVPVERLRIK